MFSLIPACANCSTNGREAGELRCLGGHLTSLQWFTRDTLCLTTDREISGVFCEFNEVCFQYWLCGSCAVNAVLPCYIESPYNGIPQWNLNILRSFSVKLSECFLPNVSHFVSASMCWVIKISLTVLPVPGSSRSRRPRRMQHKWWRHEDDTVWRAAPSSPHHWNRQAQLSWWVTCNISRDHFKSLRPFDIYSRNPL